MMDFIISKSKPALKSIGILLFYLMIWQLAYLLIQKEIYLPSPWQVLQRLRELVQEVSFWQAIAFSMCRVGWGVLLSILAGVSLGILASWSKLCYSLLHPCIVAIKSTPVISFIIIALVWFSSSNAPIFICFLMCFPIIWTNIVSGIAQVDPKLLEMAKLYRVRKLAIWHRIYLPSVMPYFTAGAVTSLGLGWKVSVAAEVLSHPKYAIGSHLYSAKIYLESSSLFAWTLVVIVLSIILEKLFTYSLMKFNQRGYRNAQHTNSQP